MNQFDFCFYFYYDVNIQEKFGLKNFNRNLIGLAPTQKIFLNIYNTCKAALTKQMVFGVILYLHFFKNHSDNCFSQMCHPTAGYSFMHECMNT